MHHRRHACHQCRGTAVLRYGNARDLCLGLEVVLPDGAIVSRLSGLRKDNAGYDLKQLFIGAEGTLGIITAATLKLFPAPTQFRHRLYRPCRPKEALELFRRMRNAFGEALTTFEILPRFGLEMVLRHTSGLRDPLAATSPWYVLAEVTSAMLLPDLSDRLEEALAEAAETGLIEDAAIAQSEQLQRLSGVCVRNFPMRRGMKAHRSNMMSACRSPASPISSLRARRPALRTCPACVLAFSAIWATATFTST